MTLLSDAIAAKKLDVRNVERFVARGSVKKDEVEKELKKLQDDEDNALWSSTESLSGDKDTSDAH